MLLIQIYVQGIMMEKKTRSGRMGMTNCEQPVDGDWFYSLTDITKFVYKHVSDKYIQKAAYIQQTKV